MGERARRDVGRDRHGSRDGRQRQRLLRINKRDVSANHRLTRFVEIIHIESESDIAGEGAIGIAVGDGPFPNADLPHRDDGRFAGLQFDGAPIRKIREAADFAFKIGGGEADEQAVGRPNRAGIGDTHLELGKAIKFGADGIGTDQFERVAGDLRGQGMGKH